MMHFKKGMYATFVVLLILLFACKEDEGIDLIHAGPWVVGWPQLGHDGEPHESDRFIVHSNYSTTDTKIETAIHAEKIIDEILRLYEITWDDYQFVSSQSDKKIVVFSDHDQRKTGGGLAYRDGIIIRALYSPLYEQNYNLTTWLRLLKHELTHVNEFLLIGDPNYQQANTVWFREGIATYVSGRKTITSLSQLNSWKEQERNVVGGGNPIAINTFADLPSNDPNTTGAYYSFFELSIRYLLDPSGNGSEISDVKSFYAALGRGKGVEKAFADNFGMTLQEFRNQYWNLMSEYLR